MDFETHQFCFVYSLKYLCQLFLARLIFQVDAAKLWTVNSFIFYACLSSSTLFTFWLCFSDFSKKSFHSLNCCFEVTQSFLPLSIVEIAHYIRLDPIGANFKLTAISERSKQRDSIARIAIGEAILDYLTDPTHYTLSSWRYSKVKMPNCFTNFVKYCGGCQEQIDLLLGYFESADEETFTRYFLSVSYCYFRAIIKQFLASFNYLGILGLLDKISRQNRHFLDYESRLTGEHRKNFINYCSYFSCLTSWFGHFRRHSELKRRLRRWFVSPDSNFSKSFASFSCLKSF